MASAGTTRVLRRAAALVAAAALITVAFLWFTRGEDTTHLPHAAGTTDYRPGLGADLYLPEHSGPAPLVVLVPGGGWVTAERSGLRPLASWLADQGLAAVTATYRAAQDGARFPTPAADVECAVDFAVARARQAGVPPDRVVLLGHSAGAQLALLVALTGQRFRDGCAYPPADVDAAIGLAGPYDLIIWQRLAEPLFGATAAAEPAAWRLANPVTWVRERPRLPVLLIHGTADDTVSPTSTTSFAVQLQAGGHPVQVQMVGGADHATIYRPSVVGDRVLRWVRSLH